MKNNCEMKRKGQNKPAALEKMMYGTIRKIDADIWPTRHPKVKLSKLVVVVTCGKLS
jgi:hypothetical protein